MGGASCGLAGCVHHPLRNLCPSPDGFLPCESCQCSPRERSSPVTVLTSILQREGLCFQAVPLRAHWHHSGLLAVANFIQEITSVAPGRAMVSPESWQTGPRKKRHVLMTLPKCILASSRFMNLSSYITGFLVEDLRSLLTEQYSPGLGPCGEPARLPPSVYLSCETLGR